MNLIFDIGNTGTKVAVFEGNKKITSFRTRDFSCEKLAHKIAPYKIDRAIISSVKIIPEFIFDLLTIDIADFHILSHQSKLPFKIEYETPDTLGTDRIAAIAGAFSSSLAKNVLVVDAGSAITYDLLEGKVYRGGNISPGISMRFKALHKFTGKLPLLTPTEDYSSPGSNTKDAIIAGVINGVVYEINEYIRTFQKNYTDLKVILTGGDAEFLNSKIKHRITYMPDLVLDGLNFILGYNG